LFTFYSQIASNPKNPFLPAVLEFCGLVVPVLYVPAFSLPYVPAF
jgi:hypothetical protein